MSSFDTIGRIADDLDVLAVALDVEADQRPSEISDQVLGTMFRAAVRLFATLASDPYDDRLLRDLRPTDACTAAAALLRSQGLTPFEFAVWFSATGAGGPPG